MCKTKDQPRTCPRTAWPHVEPNFLFPRSIGLLSCLLTLPVRSFNLSFNVCHCCRGGGANHTVTIRSCFRSRHPFHCLCIHILELTEKMLSPNLAHHCAYMHLLSPSCMLYLPLGRPLEPRLGGAGQIVVPSPACDRLSWFLRTREGMK